MSKTQFFEHRELTFHTRNLTPVSQMCTVRKIHLMEEVLLPNGVRTKSLESGMIIKVENREMVNCDDGVGTHQVVRCMGNAGGTRAAMELFDLQTGQIMTINFEGS